MTEYLPILSGMRPPGLAGGIDFEAGSVMACRRQPRMLEDTVPPRGAAVMHASRSPRCVRRARHAAAACAADSSGEMLVSGMRELHHSTVARDVDPGSRAQHADLTVIPLCRRQLALELGPARRVHREHELIVIARTESELARRIGSDRLD